MGNNEEGKSSKPDNSPSPVAPEHTNVHVYPDWSAMQAYYGPRVALPPYYNSAMASGQAPHPYMWGPPQPMMPPYGAPYAAVYSPGGVYAHPAVPIGSHPPGPVVASSPAVATPLTIEMPTKSLASADRGLMKKLKGFDGLAMSIGNGNGNAESGQHRLSQSSETEHSSDGSDGNSSGGRKRSRVGTSGTAGGDVKTEAQVSAQSDKVLGAAPGSALGKPVGSVVSPGMTPALELKNPPGAHAAKTSPTGVTQPCAVIPPEAWLQNEREVKRERRKQSNRESARRSRLRKQAETEELAQKVETLTAENVALTSEINQLAEKSEKLKLENTALMEKLKNAELGYSQEIIDEQRDPAVSTENLLSRVNNSACLDRNTGEENELYERKNSGAKLHQLLDTSPKADAVVAG